MPKGISFDSGPEYNPCFTNSREMGSHDHQAFQGSVASTSWAPNPSFSACWGKAYRGPLGLRKMWNVAKSHEWKRQKWIRNVVLESRETTPSLQTLPADLQPHCPWKTHFFLLPSSLLKIKKLCSLLLRLYGNPWSKIFIQYKKGGKIQAGCKLFESFMRRGIFPVKFFFSFLKFVSK